MADPRFSLAAIEDRVHLNDKTRVEQSMPYADSDIRHLLSCCKTMGGVLQFVAEHASCDEGDKEATENNFGLDASEVIEMAHDNMIEAARQALAEVYGSRKL